MSCHDIGRGLNSVTATVIAQYRAGNLNKEAFRAILYSCRRGVHWCDGNEGEAMEALEQAGICGVCLEEKGEVFNIFDAHEVPYPDCYNVFDTYDKTAAHFCVCADCQKTIIDRYLKEHPDVKRKGEP